MRGGFNTAIDSEGADMNGIRSCNDTPKLEGDLSTYFDKLSRYLDRHEEREELEAKPSAAERMVRLGCTGELADIGSIGLVVVRTSANGAELIEFLCPRCERLHESLPVR
jgi:hypothetical protein